jgi:hypothetical protein
VPLPADLTAAIARAGVDATAEPRLLQDALKGAIAERGGYVAWDVDRAETPVPAGSSSCSHTSDRKAKHATSTSFHPAGLRR